MQTPGWRITPEGRDFIGHVEQAETVINTVTGVEEPVVGSSAAGTAFELWMLKLLRKWYPFYAWYHQGAHKRNERGLDFIGHRIGETLNVPRTLGVQVKFHKSTSVPREIEWLKFLSGCFARRVDTAVFVTTGRLSGEQRREAHEARVTVIEGRDELARLAALHQEEPFELFDAAGD